MSYSCTEDAYRMLNELDDHNIVSAEQLRERLVMGALDRELRDAEKRADKAERELTEARSNMRQMRYIWKEGDNTPIAGGVLDTPHISQQRGIVIGCQSDEDFEL